MQWEELTGLHQIEEIKKLSNEIPVLIYKHSTRCSTSLMVLDRLEKNWIEEHKHHFKAFFLDLIAFKEVSNAIASVFNVEHESPQALVINKGQSIYNGSHYQINYPDILKAIKN
jgi:bacillithiol system protein YtxJ